jgi:hypothetical protein
MPTKEWTETVKEIEDMRASLKKTFGEYTTNAIERLIVARVKLERINEAEAKKNE